MRITFEASTLTASAEDRLITGLLIPYGEQGNSNLGKFSVPQGAFSLPTDPAQMTVNVEHEREAVFGHGARLTETPEGVMFAAYAAKTPEGDAALRDSQPGPNGEPAKLGFFSAEVASVKIAGGLAKSGRLFGAALVERPAFPSATLLASYDEDEENGTTETVLETEDEDNDTGTGSEPTETVEKYTDEFVDEDGNESSRETTITTVEDGNTTTITTETVIVEPDADTTEEEEESIVSTLTASARRGATRPAAVTSSSREASPQENLQTLFAAMSQVKQGLASQDTLLAALKQIKTDGALGVGAGGGKNKGLPDHWMGQLWDGREYDRKFINLCSLGTDVQAVRKRGYKAHRGTAAAPVDRYDGNWAGNLAEINSAEAFITEQSSTLHRFALANTIAREFFDLPGGEEYLEAFFKLIVEDYAMWSDYKALSIIGETAGAPIMARPRSPRYEGGVGLGMLIQGITTVNRTRDTASYAIVTEEVMDELLDTPKDLIPEYITFDFNTELTGSAANGKVQVVEAERASLVGLDGKPLVAADSLSVIVGAQRAIEFEENGTTPIKVDALQIAIGAVDRAVHGYVDSLVVREDSVVLISDKAAPVADKG